MVDDKKVQKTGMHSLILENRERLTVTGVVDVEASMMRWLWLIRKWGF